MTPDEKETLITVLTNLSNKIDNNKTPKLTDFAMKIAASISTAGIVAVLALFTTTIPDLRVSMNKLSWEVGYIKEQLIKDSGQTVKEISEIKAELRLHDSRMKDKDETLIRLQNRVEMIEEKAGIKK